MAVVSDTNDPMRDIIAKTAESLETALTDDPGADTADTDEGTDGAIDVADADGADDTADDAVDAGGDGAAAEEPESARDHLAQTVDQVAKDLDTPPADKAAVVDKAQPAAKAKKGEDAFAKEHGLKAADAMGRPNRIPYPVVRDRIVPNAIKKAKAEWDAKELTPLKQRADQQEKDLTSFRGVEKILLNEPRRYLAILQQSVPGYAALLAEMGGGKASGDGKEAPKPGVGTNLATDDDPEPQPDAKNEKGEAIGYTPEGFRKLREWDRRQAEAAAEKRIEKRFGKVLTREEQLEKSEQTNRAVDDAITTAAAWPGFTQNHEAILTELAKGTDPLDTYPKMHRALTDAYNTVMFGAVAKHRETEEEAKARHFEEFQASLRKAPRSTAATSTRARHEPSAEADDTQSPDDRMRNIIAGVANRLK